MQLTSMRLFLLLCVTALIVACSSPERIESAPLPLPSATAVPSASPTPTASATLTPTPSPTATATATATARPTPSPTATPEPTATPTPEPTLRIVELTLNDIDGSPLRFVSADEHPHLGGFTLVHGTLAIEGEGEISEVVLEVIEVSTGVTFEIGLAPAAQAALSTSLAETGRVEIAASQLLFEIPSTAFAPFDKSENGLLQLRVKVRATDGREAVYENDNKLYPKLVRYTADNRYFVGEEQQGGNGWVTPDAKALLEGLRGVQFGDISNMNGGPFPPHVSHQRGLDADIWFEGYNAIDGAAAGFMLNLLNQSGIIERVELVFVAYQQVDGDPFWAEIRGVTLLDGRPASTVFVPEPEHTGHFHLRLYR